MPPLGNCAGQPMPGSSPSLLSILVGLMSCLRPIAGRTGRSLSRSEAQPATGTTMSSTPYTAAQPACYARGCQSNCQRTSRAWS